MSLDIVYFSNYSGNTKRFVDKITPNGIRIPIDYDPQDSQLDISGPYVIVVPTYGGGSERASIPRQVVKFLNIESNRNFLVAVIGMGNTNFGDHYCKAARMISEKMGVPILAKVEIFGTEEDVTNIKERLAMLNEYIKV